MWVGQQKKVGAVAVVEPIPWFGGFRSAPSEFHLSFGHLKIVYETKRNKN